MRIALLSETFGRNTGYIGNMLPKYFARLGHEAHLVSMDFSPYYYLKEFQQTYAKFTGADDLIPGTMEQIEGFTLHILSHRRQFRYNRFEGLPEKLAALRPDIVQTFVAIGWVALDAALLQGRFQYKLFTGSHTTTSIFPLARKADRFWGPSRIVTFLKRGLPGRFIGSRTEKCYAATVDCADVATRFFGVPGHKMEVCPLGVDTELFHPVSEESGVRDRQQFRARNGIQQDEILCVYSGRFSTDKNPLLLAEGVARLRARGEPFRGLFIGDGVQAASIAEKDGCAVHPFVPVQQLPVIFQSADVGVWPAQESMSMLDAAACGLPIVVNDTIQATERVEGNGLRYKLSDLDDLMRVLTLLQDPELRRTLGRAGAEKMATEFSWENIARRRLADYTAALNAHPIP